MNKQQKAYAIARARVDAINEARNENEARFIRERGIVNPDGSTPKNLFEIEDEKNFESACNDFDGSPLNLFNEYSVAMEELAKAEERLIDYALSIVPKGLAETLQKGRKQYKIRRKLIDIAFRLDTKTVPKSTKQKP